MTEPRIPRSVDVHVGQRLRTARLLKDLSQETVGKAVDLTFQQIQKYEKGSNRISAGRLVQFAVLLQQPIEWFFLGAPGYQVDETDKPLVIVERFLSLPYARDVASSYIALQHNHDRNIVSQVARALARKDVDIAN